MTLQHVVEASDELSAARDHRVGISVDEDFSPQGDARASRLACELIDPCLQYLVRGTAVLTRSRTKRRLPLTSANAISELSKRA